MTTTDMPRRVAVLGATGCVGRHLCAAFAARGTDVAIARRDAPHLRPHPFLSLDLARCTGAGLAAILADEGVDTVVNATLGWGSTPEEMAHSNVRPVERLLAALPRLPDPVRLVHLGTIHEYGPVPAGTSLDEDVVPRPASLYAQAKLTASRLVLDAVRRGEVQGSVLRLTNTVGPHPARRASSGPWRHGCGGPTRPKGSTSRWPRPAATMSMSGTRPTRCSPRPRPGPPNRC